MAMVKVREKRPMRKTGEDDRGVEDRHRDDIHAAIDKWATANRKGP